MMASLFFFVGASERIPLASISTVDLEKVMTEIFSLWHEGQFYKIS